jgi:hypothetical protein
MNKKLSVILICILLMITSGSVSIAVSKNNIKPEVEFKFSISTKDPEDNMVYYKLDWDNGNESEWSDPLSIVIPKQKMSTVNYDNWFYYPKLQNYAPKGMPDFDQRQESWQNSLGMQSFCGPTSVANVLWYIDSKYSDPLGYPGDGIDNYPLVQDYNAPSNPEPGPFSDDHNFNNVNDPATPWDSVNNTYGNEFIEKIAWYVDNDGVRTGGNHLGSTSNGICEGITQWIQDVELSNSL